jgi:hypothetical protein
VFDIDGEYEAEVLQRGFGRSRRPDEAIGAGK